MSISDLTSPGAVKLAIEECDRLGREQFLGAYGFRPAREYYLIWEGNEYDSKAIAGVAYGFQFSEFGPLSSESFSGGKAKGSAGSVLSQLGFTVQGIKRDPKDWTLEECKITAEAYFECLEKKQAQIRFVRQHAIRGVSEKIGRSEGAVDRKFQNIDAVLYKVGLPRLNDGIASNAQGLLGYVVLDPLGRFVKRAASSPLPIKASLSLYVFVEPPSRKAPIENLSRVQKAVNLNFTKIEAQNRALGRSGEQFAMDVERSKFMRIGRSDLAAKVRWVSVELGDGLGYDIESVDDEGGPIFIEVKATMQGKESPFFISENELRISQREGSRYKLYRVFDLPENPRIYVLNGPLKEKLALRPRVYVAYAGSESESVD